MILNHKRTIMKPISLLIIMNLFCFAMVSQNTSPLPKLSQQVTDFYRNHPSEKIFLATDKAHYKPGETIWFSAIVTNKMNQPGDQNIASIQVKLFDAEGKIVLKDIFKLFDGVASGDFQLPLTMTKGHYFLVAGSSEQPSSTIMASVPLMIDPQYSNQWLAEVRLQDSLSIAGQKNEMFVVIRDFSGDIKKNASLRFQLSLGNVVIEKGKLKTDEKGEVTIPLSIPAQTKGEILICELSDSKGEWVEKVFLPTNLDPLIINFYPEGGNLIAGSAVKIGFTAHNKWGVPVELEAKLVDQNNKSVALAKTFTPGLGLFSVLPEAGKKYKLMVSSERGRNQSFDLPPVQTNGLSFSVAKVDPEFISANMFFADRQKHRVALAVTNGANLDWAADMDIDGMGRVKIPVDNLPHGINLLSVFSEEGTLLAERVVYTEKKQQLNVEVKSSKSTLTGGESTKVVLKITDSENHPVTGKLILSVVDKYRLSENRETIDECLLFNSELENSFSLISKSIGNGISNNALLDIYLIANRLKGFDWSQIQQSKTAPASNENSVQGLTGIVTDKNGTRINRAKVTLVNNKNMQLHTTTTNSNGVFSFPNLTQINPEDFSAKATDQDGKRELKVTINKNSGTSESEWIKKEALKMKLMQGNKMPDSNYLSKNPVLFIRASKTQTGKSIALDNQRNLLNTATSLLDVIKSIKPYKIMNNQIVFIGTENSINYQGGALIVVDGQQMGTDISAVSNISPLEVDHINVSTNPMDIQRYTGLNSVGVIEINLKKAKVPENTEDEAKVIKSNYDGVFRLPNNFPKQPTNPKRDTRTTLLWIPNQIVDQSGQFEFDITAGRVLSDFLIEVQSISPEGRIGVGSTAISVVK